MNNFLRGLPDGIGRRERRNCRSLIFDVSYSFHRVSFLSLLTTLLRHSPSFHYSSNERKEKERKEGRKDEPTKKKPKDQTRKSTRDEGGLVSSSGSTLLAVTTLLLLTSVYRSDRFVSIVLRFSCADYPSSPSRSTTSESRSTTTAQVIEDESEERRKRKEGATHKVLQSCNLHLHHPVVGHIHLRHLAVGRNLLLRLVGLLITYFVSFRTRIANSDRGRERKTRGGRTGGGEEGRESGGRSAEKEGGEDE